MSHHHHHDHDHDHHHEHTAGKELTFNEKLVKLLEHWIRHNAGHSETYVEWAEKARENNLAQVAELLVRAAETTSAVNRSFEDALEIMRKS